MLCKFRIKYHGAMPGTRRFAAFLNRAKRGAWSDAGLFWHKKLRPKHFTNRGATEYGYQPREGERNRPGRAGFKRSYTGRKLRQFGHTRPLEYTGHSRALTRLRDVRTLTKGRGVRVVLHSPGYNRRATGSSIRMAAELTTISEREANQIVRLWNRSLERRLKRYK